MFVALGIQHAKRTRLIILSSVACQASTIFFFQFISQTAWISGGKMLQNTNCVFWFSLQLFAETLFILRRIQRDIATNVHSSLCKVLV